MSRENLRSGFSTGTAATAAAKAALEAVLTGKVTADQRVTLPQGGDLTISIKEVDLRSDVEAEATVIKDGGDDPDVTNKAEIKARVLRGQGAGEEGVTFRGGPGVGRVTKPGLPLAVGEPAINPVPREMIRQGIEEIWDAYGNGSKLDVIVEISVPRGEKLARRTLNPRLGIVGGISILGTTGLVTPYSHEAYTATIESGMNVAQALGIKEIVLTTGGKSEKISMALRPDLPEEAFIQFADFFGFSLEHTRDHDFERVGVVSFFGKAVKQAQGLSYTHAHRAPMDLARLAEWLNKAGAEKALVEKVANANTARHALEALREHDALSLVEVVGRRMYDACRNFAGTDIDLWVRIFDFDSTLLYRKP